MSKTVIKHIGTKYHSGRYPYGSGGNAHQHSTTFLDNVAALKTEGFTEKEIAKALGMSTTKLRQEKTLAKTAQKEALRSRAAYLRGKNLSYTAISNKLGVPKSTLRDLLKSTETSKRAIIETIANVLENAIKKFRYIDIGSGVEHWLGVSALKMKNAVSLLEKKGYMKYRIRVNQLGTNHKTYMVVLAAPDVTYKEVWENIERIRTPKGQFLDDMTYLKPAAPTNIDPKRITVRFAEDGGALRDGVIELRRGVADLDLGGKNYAQVRIAVGGKKYLKGMAVYADDLPKGVDIRFNTNKSSEVGKMEALKPLKNDPDNPFGAAVLPARTYTNSKGEKLRSAINIVYEEGHWNKWSSTLSSQFLAKQSAKLAAKQLDHKYQNDLLELKEIMALTNPVVRNHLLLAFSDTADASAVHLKAAALPQQSTNVLLPVPSIKPSEVYAPGYENGTPVVLVRYPHGGKFEIPALTVNNKNRAARKMIGTDATDAIGIHPSVAQKLSGADYDGDTAIVIPNKRGEIKNSPSLVGLKNFDPKLVYPSVPGMKRMTPEGTQLHMGKISNLITDMTILGAPPSELARAVRHSMVVIDAEKHGLNYELSYAQNGIAALKKKYQGSSRGGAATLLSRAKSQMRVNERKEYFSIDPETGAKVHAYTNASYLNDAGKKVPRTTMSTKMAETTDANTLSSGTVMEKVYARHANRMKALANKARLASLKSEPIPYSPEAYKTYKAEVDSLKAKLALAQRNAPLERQAQRLGNAMLRDLKISDPTMSKRDLKAARGRMLVSARARVGAAKPRIEISEREWAAIQLGAIRKTPLQNILKNADMDVVRELATPKTRHGISPAKENRARELLKAGYTVAEVAAATGATKSQIDSIEGVR